MKKLYFLLLLICSPQAIYSQNDSLLYRHSIAINLTDLFIHRLFLTYSTPINSNKYLEISCGYRQSYTKTVNSALLLLFFKDASWYYNSIALRVGIKRYFDNDKFISYSTIFNYKFFNSIRFNRYEDHEGDMYDVDYIISRSKIQFGGLIKVGFFSRAKWIHVISENYIGLGILHSFDSETINAKYYLYNVADLTPIKSHRHRIVPTIYFGVSFGLAK